MKQYQVGVVGATGMVGQRFVSLLAQHPWFHLAVVAASPRSAGKTYGEAVGSRWAMPDPMPEQVKNMVVLDGTTASRTSMVTLLMAGLMACPMPTMASRGIP